MSDTIDTTDAALCVERIAEYQRVQRLSDASLVRTLPTLGSARTWRRMATANWADLPLAVWLPKLQEAVAFIDGAPAPASEVADGGRLDGVPTAFVSRHLAEADRCRREKNLALARSHCRAARQAIENFQRSLTQIPAPAPV